MSKAGFATDYLKKSTLCNLIAKIMSPRFPIFTLNRLVLKKLAFQTGYKRYKDMNISQICDTLIPLLR